MPITMEQFYRQYLKDVDIKESMIDHVLQTEIRRAFYGGCTQILNAFHQIGDVSELDQVIRDLDAYWKKQLSDDPD